MNNVLRVLHKLLSADTSANDLSGAALTANQAAIIARHPDLNPSLFNSAYWQNQRWHNTSLQSLLGDLSADWVKNKFNYYIPYSPSVEERPIICFAINNLQVKTRGDHTGFMGDLQIQVIVDSSQDNATKENITNRIFKILGESDQVDQDKCVPCGLQSMTYQFQTISSDVSNFDSNSIGYSFTCAIVDL